MTQDQLAKRIGTSQNTISLIESGGSSHLIPRICEVLNIPGPLYTWKPEQREWSVLGHELQELDEAMFTNVLNLIKGRLNQSSTETTPKAPPPPPKKLKPIGSANLTGLPSGREPLRGADETPGETKRKR